jgi:hypothetical protein
MKQCESDYRSSVGIAITFFSGMKLVLGTFIFSMNSTSFLARTMLQGGMRTSPDSLLDWL